MKLPFEMHFGKIGNLTLNIPWQQNFSVPTTITVEDAHILLSLLKQDEWQFLDLISFKAKSQTLINFISSKLDKLTEVLEQKEQASKTKNSKGYVDRILMKVLDNLHVNFKHVNIRVEDENNFSLGVTLEELFIVNTNEKWEQVFIDRNKKQNENMTVYKLLQLSNFGMYLKCNDKLIISHNENVNDIEDKMKMLFPKDAKQITDIDYLIKPSKLTLHYINIHIYSITHCKTKTSK
jgi:vacuolar protein sorting-associated protein 13A/C